MARPRFLIVPAFAIAALAAPAPAAAHISLEKGGTHLSRYGDTDAAIKAQPCGVKDGKRGTNVYTYEPGQTITITVLESVPHPSYFRIAFDTDGDDGFKDPASIDPIDPARACPDGPGDHCGASDFYNTPEVLMDNLNPHLPAPTDFFTPPKYTWQVTLPDVECTNCTLQLIQVMEDDAFHGPYDPTPGVGVEDVYHQCIDVVLKRTGGSGTGGAPGSGGTTAAGTGGGTAAGGGVAAGGDTGLPPGTGGAGTGGDTGLPPSTGTGGTTGAGTSTGGSSPTGTGGATGTGWDAGGEPSPSSPGSASSSDDGGCTVGNGRTPRSGLPAAALALGLGALAARRRRTARRG